jgi:hypothetical protein
MEFISKALVFKNRDQNLIWKNACSLSPGRILNKEGISKALVFKNRDQNLMWKNVCSLSRGRFLNME